MRAWALGAIGATLFGLGACSSSTTNQGGGGTGAATATGGASSGGASSGGAPTGGSAGSGGAGGVAGGDGGPGDGGAFCPHADMVAVGSAFCIDKTEVTTGKYAEFLAFAADAGANNLTGLAACNAQTNYAPDTMTGCPEAPYTTDTGLPVRCVDWCGAYAFCKWAKKRLCGAIPTDAADPLESAVKDKNQWYTACIGDGSDTYFYGPSFNDETCQTSAAGTSGPVNVGSKLDCKSIWFKGLVDMTGNVAEWEDSCDSLTSPTAACHVRGGSYLGSQGADLACASAAKLTRTTRLPEIGFRCCWDPSVK